MIIVKLYGGIGNQMFQYAAAKRLALVNNTQLFLDITHYNKLVLPYGLPYRSFDLSIFNMNYQIASEKEICFFKNAASSFQSRVVRKIKNIFSPTLVVTEPHFHFYPQLLMEKGSLYIDGYWQSEKYFKDIEDIINSEFQINLSLNEEELRLVEKIKATNSVCLNIRRQEFASNPLVDDFIGIEYFNKAVELIAQKVDSPHFFIISDELSWCKENLNLKYDHTFVEEHLFGEKYKNCLFYMTSCKHNIIPNSTFGWWGAWLNPNPNKIIIAPKSWLKDKTKNTKDILPDSWIKL